MRIAFLPLDERPCNSKYIQMMADDTDKLTLVSCPLSILGKQKEPGDRQAIARFIKEQAQISDAMVLSLDTLFYGGLIPSRTHHLTRKDLTESFALLREVKAKHPQVALYASITLMRSPTYNSAVEEPDYYAQYGSALHRRAYLSDKKTREQLDEAEQKELAKIVIPKAILEDYEARRTFNEAVNVEVLKLVKEKIIDFLVIPQDDARPFGYTAITQRRIVAQITALDLENKVNIYPGADEVGNTLVTRAYVDFYQLEPKIYPFFASTLGPSIVPLYEDRPMLETLKYHIRACGAQLVETAGEADFILAIDAPGKIMQRAREQLEQVDVTYTSYRNLNDFVLKIRTYIEAGQEVALCDSAYGNGGDLSLVKRLDSFDLLDKLLAYAGWNTNANTLGTVLAAAILGHDTGHSLLRHMIYRYIEDVCYQTVVRQVVQVKELPKLGVVDYNLEKKLPEVCGAIQTRLSELYHTWHLSTKIPVTISAVALPWRRLFEVDFDLQIKKAGQ